MITSTEVLAEIETIADSSIKKATNYETKTHAQLISLLVKVVQTQQFLIEGLQQEVRALRDGPQ